MFFISQGSLHTFWVGGLAIGKGIDFSHIGVSNGINFYNFGVRNNTDIQDLGVRFKVDILYTKNLYKVRPGILFSKNWY